MSEFVESIERVQAGSSAEMVEAAYEDILNKYNTIVIAEKYSGIYEETLVNRENTFE